MNRTDRAGCPASGIGDMNCAAVAARVKAMSKVFACLLIVAAVLTRPATGQGFSDLVNFKGNAHNGIGIYGVSVFTGYSSSFYPANSLNLGSLAASGLHGDVSYGASASVGWQHHRRGTDITVLYSGTYIGNGHYSRFNAYDQSINLGLSKSLSPKWVFSFSADGESNSLTNFVLRPTNLAVLSQVAADPNDLAAAFTGAQFSSSQAASMLGGTVVPMQALLLSERILSYSAQASVTYAATSRLSFRFGSVTASGEQFSNKNNPAVPNYRIPTSLGVNGGVGFSYALSPRTNIGADLSETRQVNYYQSVYVTNASGSLGRRFSPRWFGTINGGGAYTRVTSQTFGGSPQGRQMTGGASLGFRAYSSTLLASYSRGASETYGFATGTYTSAGGSWYRRRPGSRMSLETSFANVKTYNTGYANVSGWQAGAAVSEQMSNHMNLSLAYAYMKNTGAYLGNPVDFGVHSVRLSFGWAPNPVRSEPATGGR